MAWEKRLFLLCICFMGSHHVVVGQAKTQSNTFAVVIGITKYKDSTLSTLQFADRDASLFEQYLQSKAGGNLPVDNIRLLVNENATIAAIYDALNWLQERCKPGDKAYFYFSGHGDVETNNKGLGYLLAHNSPPSNYRNNAITIEDLNKMAAYLSTKSKATVVLITDACHSGELAGDYYKGRQLVANQLRLILNNEVRLAACRVDEKAGEGEEWGGGRGVFSYYLLKGLEGLADVNRNDTIQLQELTSYLDSAFAADKDLIRNKLNQHPVLAGNPGLPMAVVDRAALEIANKSIVKPQQNSQIPSVFHIFQPLGEQPIDYLFGLVKTKTFETKLPISSYVKIPADHLPTKIVDDCIAYQQKLEKEKKALGIARPQDPGIYFFADIDTLKLLKNQFSTSKALVESFNERFTQMVHGEAQDMINAYLDGDFAELEKREYYYNGNRKYADFLQMLRVALHIAPTDDYLYPLLAVQEAYISGLADRLKIATTPNMSALLASAFKYQKKALKLEPYAAFIHNEMGNLHMLSKEYARAESEFEMAKELSPTWAIPWSNTIRLGLATGNLKKALYAVKMADSLQSEQSYTLNNAGLVMAKQGDLLTAERYFQKAITKEKTHFFPYERLGELYLQAGDYKKADSLLAAAYRRKNGFEMNPRATEFGIGAIEVATMPKFIEDSCYFLDRVEMPVFKPYLKLVNAFDLAQSNPDSALIIMEELARDMGDFPLMRHYMGKALFAQQKWEQATRLLLQAIRTYQSDSALSASIQSVLKIRNDTVNCLIAKFMQYDYNVLEDHYLLGSIYEREGALGKAIEQYASIISIENELQKEQAALKESYRPPGMNSSKFQKLILEENYRALSYTYQNPIPIGGYIRMANIYEKLGDYDRAERAYLQQIQRCREAADLRKAQTGPVPSRISVIENNCPYCLALNRPTEASTFNFYQRMLKLFPRDSEWQEKAGMFLYSRLLIAFQKVPAGKYKIAYESVKNYAYPFLAVENAFVPSEVRFELPGTDETMIIPTPKYDPLKEALESLKLAVRLSGEIMPKPAVLEAIADLNSWMGNQQVAFETYKELIRNQEPATALRSKIIDYSFVIYELPFAMDQLAILYELGNATQAQKTQLADCYALNGSTDKALEILNKLATANNTPKVELDMLYAKTYWLTGSYPKALSYLNPLALAHNSSMNPDSTTKLTASMSYSIARLKALLKQNEKAVAALGKALQGGFAYGYVLETDNAWNLLRTSAGWKTLKKQYADRFKLMEYSEHESEDLSTIRKYLIPD